MQNSHCCLVFDRLGAMNIDVIGDGGDASHHHQHSAQFVVREVEGVAETRLLFHCAALQIIDNVESREQRLGNGRLG